MEPVHHSTVDTDHENAPAANQHTSEMPMNTARLSRSARFAEVSLIHIFSSVIDHMYADVRKIR